MAAALTERTKKGPLGEAGQMNHAGSAFTTVRAGAPRMGCGASKRVRRTCLRSRLSVACIADVASIWAICDAGVTVRKRREKTAELAKKGVAAAAPRSGRSLY